MEKRFDGKAAIRLFKYILKEYKFRFILMVIFVAISSLVTVASTLFLEKLIDDYITPMMQQANPDFAPLIRALAIMGVIYVCGVLSTYIYNRIMVVIGQGTLKNIRNEMFEKMQKLPIRYFDTHLHGDIMSHFTNDIDALRELCTRGIPQILSMSVTIIVTFITMLSTSWLLTLVVLLVTIVMLNVTKRIGGKSSKYFMKQQESLGIVDGYIEEMMAGQKVIKIFNHEEEAKKDFKKLNDELFEDSKNANSYANILMPALANLGNLMYVLVGFFGGILLINGVSGITLGVVVAFVNLSKNFAMPISRLSQQLNTTVMAIAGAKRIFELMDEEPEFDEGYVTLVNAEKDGDELKEVDHYTGTWAWKHPHHDGTLTYEELKGHIEMVDVDFGYDEGKTILHDISLYAKPRSKDCFCWSNRSSEKQQ